MIIVYERSLMVYTGALRNNFLISNYIPQNPIWGLPNPTFTIYVTVFSLICVMAFTSSKRVMKSSDPSLENEKQIFFS
jgi:hypothetical protein